MFFNTTKADGIIKKLVEFNDNATPQHKFDHNERALLERALKALASRCDFFKTLPLTLGFQRRRPCKGRRAFLRIAGEAPGLG